MSILLVSAAFAWTHQEPSVDAIRRSSAQAIGIAPADQTWKLEGISKEASLWQSFELVTDGAFRFRRNVFGPLPQSEGFDGRTAWNVGASGVPHIATRANRELSRLVEYIIDGSWASPAAPLRFRRLPDEAGAPALEVRLEEGVSASVLRVDGKTFLPASLSYWGTDGADTWRFGGYKKFAQRTLATRIEHEGGDGNESLVVESATPDPKARGGYSEPAVENGAKFDRSVPHEIVVKRVGNHLFVHPEVDGADEGWFFFDTGADCLVIDSAVAKKHGQPLLGSQATAGVVGNTDMAVSRGATLKLGPLTLLRPTYLQMDLSGLSKVFGIPVVGICGYDVLARAAWDIDPARNQIGVYEPGQAPLPLGMKWTSFDFAGNVPDLRCRFEGERAGYFHLDTGSGSAVDFCSPAVARYGFVSDRSVTKSMTSGAGGDAESRNGTLAWFELAGRRFEKVRTGFQLTKKGVLASPFFDGNIGMGLLGRGRLVLDYRASRLAFAKS